MPSPDLMGLWGGRVPSGSEQTDFVGSARGPRAHALCGFSGLRPSDSQGFGPRIRGLLRCGSEAKKICVLVLAPCMVFHCRDVCVNRSSQQERRPRNRPPYMSHRRAKANQRKRHRLRDLWPTHRGTTTSAFLAQVVFTGSLAGAQRRVFGFVVFRVPNGSRHCLASSPAGAGQDAKHRRSLVGPPDPNKN